MIPAALPPRSLPGNSAGLDRRACTPSSEHRSDRTRTHGNPSTPAPATEHWTATRTSGHNQGGVRAVLGGPGTPQVCSSRGPWASVLPGSWTSSTRIADPSRLISPAMMAKPIDGHTPGHGGQDHRLLPASPQRPTDNDTLPDQGSQDDRLLPGSRPRQPGRLTSPPTRAAKTYSASRPRQPGRRTATLPNRRLRNPRPSSAMAPTSQEVPRHLTGGSILASTRVG